jgi:ribonuclease HI
VQTLNPATFLPTEEGPPDHDCEEVMDEMYTSRPDLTDAPLSDAELELFMDGSSFVQGGRQKVRFAVTTTNDIIKAEVLPQEWSAQRAELWVLVHALQYAKGKWVNIYTDSKCAFATMHVPGAIYKKRGLLMVGGKEIKNKEEGDSKMATRERKKKACFLK